jgi:endonuclease-3 related protein
MTAGPRRALRAVYDTLLRTHGPQRWWPAETPFEVMVGAVLTQNTAWVNVERAIANLSGAGVLDPQAIVALPEADLAVLLRPSGYFNVKARRLRAFCAWYLEAGGHPVLARLGTPELRRALLEVPGVGRETADDILLYAFARPVFVVDAYTRRLFGRLGLVEPDADYERLRRVFEEALGPQVVLYNEYHALIVRHAKEVCRSRPLCGRCHLLARCEAGARTGRE